MRVASRAWVLTLALLPAPLSAWAQNTNSSAIAGVVTDSSQAVLPGVTVEAASPALIEKIRTTVTNGEGRYLLADLRPGQYTVTFTLTGFGTVKRENIQLSGGFTATINGELRVGDISEVITVTGASPTVDVQNARGIAVLKRELLDTLPFNQSMSGFVALTPGLTGNTLSAGVTRDVGGSTGEPPRYQTIHGSDGGMLSLDGIKALTGILSRHHPPNYVIVQEVVLETTGGSAEAWTGGPNMNVVTKDGGNDIKGTLSGFYSGSGFDSNNLSDRLRARGLTSYNEQKLHYDVGVWLGGAILKDRLWFSISPRKKNDEYYVAGNYFNATPHTLFYTPDLSRPAFSPRPSWDLTSKLTYKATGNNKFTFSSYKYYYCTCYSGVETNRTPDASRNTKFDPVHLMSALWTNPVSNRLLFEAGVAYHDVQGIGATPVEGQLPTDRAVLNAATGIWYGANFNNSSAADYGRGPTPNTLTRGSLSYITGSHAFKVGFTTFHLKSLQTAAPFLPEAYTFRGTVPISIAQTASPSYFEGRLNTIGLFVQDQWTTGRLTLNGGLRFDAINGYAPAQTKPAGKYLAAVSFPEVRDIPNWKDVSPRFGASVDLFGNGKTAIKGSAGRYALANNFTHVFTQTYAPSSALVLNTSRVWTDTNGNYIPDCDLTLKTANNECGPMQNQNFGTSVVNTRPSDEVREGLNAAPYLWQTSASFQHEVMPNVALSFGYYRTWYGNITATDNVEVVPADFSPYCLAAPADSRLPGGGGYQLCGLYDVSAARIGRVSNLVVNSNTVGGRSEVFNGMDALISARFSRGLTLSGGISSGRLVTDNCATPDAPGQFCRRVIPWSGLTEVKLAAAYPLPWWGLQTSATYQNVPGMPWTATYAAPNSAIAPSLGRNLSSCAATGPCAATVAGVNLLEPFSVYERRGQQLDIRFSKTIQVGRIRTLATLDVFNATNRGDVLAMTTGFGPTWSRPVSIVPGRMIKIGTQVNF